MADKKCALITGVTGQDGACLAEFLLDKGYEVYGVKRRASTKQLDLLQTSVIRQLSSKSRQFFKT